MVKIKQTLAIVLILASSLFFSQLIVVNDVYAEKCSDFETSILPCGEDSSKSGVEGTGLWGLLMLVINILTAGIGVAAVGGVVYGAVLYTTSGGSPDQVKKALQIIRNVAIGLVMYALMYAFLNYIIPGGMFS